MSVRVRVRVWGRREGQGSSRGRARPLGGARRADVVPCDGDHAEVVEDDDEDELQDAQQEEVGDGHAAHVHHDLRPIAHALEPAHLARDVRGERAIGGHAAEVGLRVEGGRGDEEEEGERERGGDAVREVVLEALEDAPRELDRDDDRGEAGLGQHDVRRRARGVRRALHRDPHVGLLERGRIVDAVTGHAHRPATPAQGLDDVELVLGVHPREAVCNLDELGTWPGGGVGVEVG